MRSHAIFVRKAQLSMPLLPSQWINNNKLAQPPHPSSCSESIEISDKKQRGTATDSCNNNREHVSWDNGSRQQIAPRSGLRLRRCHDTSCTLTAAPNALPSLPCILETPRYPIIKIERSSNAGAQLQNGRYGSTIGSTSGPGISPMSGTFMEEEQEGT